MTDQHLDYLADWLDREAKKSDLPTYYLQGRTAGLRDAFEYLAILRMQVKKESEERRQDDAAQGLVGRATATRTLCAKDPSSGFYAGCMIRDGACSNSGWECDGQGNLTKSPNAKLCEHGRESAPGKEQP